MIEQDEIDKLRTWAEAQPLIAELWVYGSRVGGTNQEDSDLDIAVTLELLNYNLHANWLQNNGTWARQLTCLMDYTVHLIALNEDIRPPDHDPHRYEESRKLLVYPLKARATD